MTDKPPTDRPEEKRVWTGHREAQRRRLARLPLVEKIAWLEETQRVVEHLQKQRKKGQ